MITENDIPAGAWKLALALAAAIWGGSFVVIKGALDVVPPCWLMCVRFALAALVLGAVFHKRLAKSLDSRHLIAGIVVGVFCGLGFVVQNVGLTTITPGRNAFLTATYCVMVPFMSWAAFRRAPAASNFAAALLAICGVGLLSLGDDLSFSLSAGEWLTLLSAVFYALQIIAVSRFAGGCDVMVLTVVQLVTCSVVALFSALAVGEPLDAGVFAEPGILAALAYLVLLSSCTCFVLQNLGQAHVPAAQASLLLSLESVFAVIASVVFYGEVVTPRMAAGFASIFAAVLVSEVGAPAFNRLRGRLGLGDAKKPASEVAPEGGDA